MILFSSKHIIKFQILEIKQNIKQVNDNTWEIRNKKK